MKKVRVFCCVLALLLLAGCAEGSGNLSGSEIKLPSSLTKPVKLGETMINAAEGLPDMTIVSSESKNAAEGFQLLSEMDYSKVDEFYYAYATGGTAEELAVIRLKNAKDMDQAKSSLVCHRENKIYLFQNSDPSQVPLLEDSEIQYLDNVLVMAVCQNPEEVIQALLGGKA